MPPFSDCTFSEHLKNFTLYVAIRSILETPQQYDDKTLAVLGIAFERQRPLYNRSMEYLDQLDDAQREQIFSQTHPEQFYPTPENINGGLSEGAVPSGIPIEDVFLLWKTEYESWGETTYFETEKADKRSGPRAKPKDYFSVHSSAPVYDIGETIARGDFTTPGDGRFPTARIVGGTEGRIEILPFWDHNTNQPLTPQRINLVATTDTSEFSNMQEEAMRIATSYNEEMATYFYAMDAYWLMNAKNRDDYVQLDICDLLQYSGKKPVKTHGRYTGTFRPDQLQRAGMMVYGMGFSMVEIEKTIIKGVGERSHFKRLWDVSDMYMMETLDNERFIESMTYRPNEFLRNVSFGSRRETALLMSKVLSLDYAKMVTARRLGRYYTWLWRDRAYHGDIAAPIRCEKLLERAGIEVEKGNERYARRKLETALNRLESEEIISQWVLYEQDGTPADLGKRIPFSQWLEMKISVAPPDVILLHYAGNLRQPFDMDTPAQFDFTKLREERKRRGYTLSMLSEEIGVEISTLSRIEAGKTKRPRKEQIDAIQKWLGQ